MPAHTIIEFGPIDNVGPHLESLSQAVIELQKIDPRKLYGDAAIIAGGIQGLRIVLDRIEALQHRTAAE